ncbi:MAG: DMT family transporter [Crocinitomicaceae bacterium]|nr:DMT family transporter [Crocinitomicaceae bacterium]
MLDIILGILCFNVILICFKLIGKYHVDNLQAITVNYITAGLLSFTLAPEIPAVSSIVKSDWFFYAVGVGVMFILVFNLLALASQKIGMGISTVANKMSLVIPIIAAVILFEGETMTALKVIGIILALAGVYFTTMSGTKLNFDIKYLWLILVIFFGQGLADVLFNCAKEWYVDASLNGLFFIVIFLSAGIVGLLKLIPKLINGSSKFAFKNILWGIALGVPNFLTLWFFFRSLDSGQLEVSQVNPIYNIGVVVISSLIGFIFFKEKLSLSNWFGVLLSVASIAAIMLAS